MQTAHAEQGPVDFGLDEHAPEAPDVGIAITLLGGSKIAAFSQGQPIVLHGSYRADNMLIRLCREGLAESILVTLVRADRPWGRTLRLAEPSALVLRPLSPPAPDDASSGYREDGNFQFDLVQFLAFPESREDTRWQRSWAHTTPKDWTSRSADPVQEESPEP